uniref:SERPIN domain-containing protein n=1 Tax=Taenia asiatica TaxID=60517 RepID=A0A0R3WER3_TAEAS
LPLRFCPFRSNFIPTFELNLTINENYFNRLVLFSRGSKKNCFVSPLSIYCGLSLAFSGSSGRSNHEIAQVLQVSKQQLKDHDSTLAHLGSHLDAVSDGDTGKTLVLANGLFLESTIEVKRLFKKALEKYFHTDSHMVDFASNAEKARKQINAWVSDHTCKKISDLMSRESIDSQTRLVLANAIYFKGTWKNVFHRDATTDWPFQTLHDGKVQVPMMSENGVYEMSRFDELSATALKIPFKFHEMLIVLPDAKDGLMELLEKIFDPNHILRFKELFDKSKYEPSRVELHLPKFKLGGVESLNMERPLSAMGLETVFNHNQADFSRITEKEKLHISSVVHQAVIEVNEEGAEAAAATGMAIAPMCLCPDFTVDHPFLFFIVTETGVPAFIGHVVNPLA